MELEKYQDLFDAYKIRFGNTFSYFDTANSGELRARAAELMQQAIKGDRDAITDADLGIDIPEDAVS